MIVKVSGKRPKMGRQNVDSVDDLYQDDRRRRWEVEPGQWAVQMLYLILNARHRAAVGLVINNRSNVDVASDCHGHVYRSSRSLDLTDRRHGQRLLAPR